MKTILKSAIAVAALAGATALIPGAAIAGVSLSIGVGVPGAVYVSPYGADYVAYDDDYYYDPIYIGGAWYHGPYRWRMEHGERVFFVDGRWHRDEWRGGARPNTIMFHNGGSFRDGRNYGFGGAERINARFHAAKSEVRDDRHDVNSDRKDLKNDRKDLRQDRRDRDDSKN